MKPRNRTTGARLRIVLEPEIALGPGKADLLEEIEQTGSIAAAGRAMGMSYKRAWSLVQALNDGGGAPLVETSRGGTGQGGAVLTGLGREVVSRYRHMQQATREAIDDDLAALRQLLPRN